MAVLTILGSRQLAATGGNGFRLFRPFWRFSHLPPVATGCDRWAPQTLHTLRREEAPMRRTWVAKPRGRDPA